MSLDAKELLVQEFTDARDRWAYQRIELMMRFSDQRIVIADRRFNLNIGLISIAAAFLTIVVPLVGANFSGDFNIATVLFFLCAIIGVFDVLWTIRKDQREMAEDNQWQLKILKDHEIKADTVRAELLKGIVPDKGIRDYFADEETLILKMRDRAREREHSAHTRLLKAVQYVFLLSFFFGFIFLAIAMFPEFKDIRF